MCMCVKDYIDAAEEAYSHAWCRNVALKTLLQNKWRGMMDIARHHPLLHLKRKNELFSESEQKLGVVRMIDKLIKSGRK